MPARTVLKLEGNDWKARLLFLSQLARDSGPVQQHRGLLLPETRPAGPQSGFFQRAFKAAKMFVQRLF